MKLYRRTAVVFLIVAGVAFAGLRYFLTSPFLARQVAGHLRSRFGLAVTVEGIRVGFGGTTLYNVHLAGDDGHLPLLRVDRLETDLTLWKLLLGQTTPQEITLQGAHLTLCFDQSGEWVAPLPGAAPALPRAHLRAGQLTLRREGWSTLAISGIDAEITDEGQLLVTGAFHDTAWKGWKFHGSFCGAETALLLVSDGEVPLSPALLQTIPFVPPDIWKHVHYGGPTAVEVHLAHRPRDAATHYRVRLRPRRGLVEIPELDFVCADVRGEVLVEDGRVTLAGLEGRALNGSVRVAGMLDFTGEVAGFRGRVEWRDVDLSSYIPESPPARVNRGQAEVSGTIAGVWGGIGAIALQRCELVHDDGPVREGNAVRVLAAGSVTAEGRLDLNATARTSRAPPETPVRLLGEALSHFLVHVRVTGTVERPAYQVNPLPRLTADARRFLLPHPDSK
jgi:hypothetical protein